jgi:hypothetical protein
MQNRYDNTVSSSPPATPESVNSTFVTPPSVRSQARSVTSIDLLADEHIVKSLATELHNTSSSKKSATKIKNYWVLPAPQLEEKLKIVESISRASRQQIPRSGWAY